MKAVMGMISSLCFMLTYQSATAQTVFNGTNEMLAAYAVNTILYCESVGGKWVGTSVDEFYVACHTAENPRRTETYPVRQLLVAHWEIESEYRSQDHADIHIRDNVTLRLKKTG